MSGQILLSVVWLTINIWATSFVFGRAAGNDNKFLYCLMIWILPFFGAALAALLSSLNTDVENDASRVRMFQAIIDKLKAD